MRRILPLALALFTGCTTKPLNPATVEPLRVQGTLDFGGVYLGASKRLELTVSNPNRAARSLEFSLALPFGAPASLTLGGGEATSVAFTFSPTTAGPVEASLLIDETELAVSGAGLAPLECAPQGACWSARFDPEAGACTAAPLPEDSACVSPCVVEGHCRSGVCSFEACDDADQCTTDACSPLVGCLHAATVCAAATDPCQAPRCDPQVGCVATPVTDGVFCGPDDCVRGTAPVCISGQCVERPRPAGQLCFETLAGVAGGPGHVDGRGAGVRFYSNRVLTADRFGNLVVFDGRGVRRVTSGGVVSTIVTNDLSGQIHDGLGTAGFGRVGAATADAWGDVLFVDGDGTCVRELSSAGRVSTLTPGCALQGVSDVLRTLDRRVWVIAGRELFELRPDGSLAPRLTLLGPGETRLGGAAGAALVFNDGSRVFALGLGDGGAPVSLGTLPQPLVRLWSLSEVGALYSRVTDAGCEHGFAQHDGGTTPLFFTPPQGANTCLETQDNVSTFTGARVLNLAAADDGTTWAMDRGTLLTKILDGGRVFVAGAADRAGSADGFGADAGLNVTAGFGFSRQVFDSLAVADDGRLTLSDSFGASLRTWDDDGGLQTITRGLTATTGLSRARDGGLWVVTSRYVSDGGTGSVNTGLHRLDAPTGQLSFVAPLSLAADSGWAAASWLLTESAPAVSETADAIVLLHRSGFLMRFDGQQQNDLFFESQNSPLLDGVLPDAGLEDPRALVFTGGGELAFVDGNAIRRLRGGVLTTIAGSSQAGYLDGPVRLARFNHPLALGLHPNGDLVVADTENHVIRAISPLGLVRTLGRLTDRPSGVTVAPNGDVYVLVRHALLRGR